MKGSPLQQRTPSPEYAYSAFGQSSERPTTEVVPNVIYQPSEPPFGDIRRASVFQDVGRRVSYASHGSGSGHSVESLTPAPSPKFYRPIGQSEERSQSWTADILEDSESTGSSTFHGPPGSGHAVEASKPAPSPNPNDSRLACSEVDQSLDRNPSSKQSSWQGTRYHSNMNNTMSSQSDPGVQKMIRENIESLGTGTGVNRRISFQIGARWELPYCLSKLYPPGTLLGDILTVTGDSIDAFAISCRAYTAQMLPGIPEHFLRVLETSLCQGARSDSVLAESHFSHSEPFSTTGPVTARFGHDPGYLQPGVPRISSLIVDLAGPSEGCSQIVTLISWLSAAVRLSDEENIAISYVECTINQMSRELAIDMFAPIPISDGVCWHNLFSYSVIAAQFDIPSRSQGRGLEIQINELLSRSRSMRFLKMCGCIVAEAPQNLLVVMDEIPADGGFQWHLEEKCCKISDNGTRGKLTAAEILSRPIFRSCVKNVEYESLKSARNFLGWTAAAVVKLGTSSKIPRDLTPSGAKGPIPTRTRVTSYNFGIGLSHWGAFSLGATATTSSIATRYARKAEKDLQFTLQDLEHENIVIYDHRRKTAWYLPKLSVLLYMVQIFCVYRGLRAYHQDSLKQTSIPIAEEMSDGGVAASKVINESLRLRLKGKSKDIAFAEALEAICHTLEISQQFASEAWDAALGHGRAAPRCIVGFEIMDLVKEQTLVKVKEEEVNQPWAHLTQDGGLVLFCKNLGQAIAPSQKTSLCEEWQQVPPGKFYLGAYGYGLRRLLLNFDRSRLSDRLEWDFNPPTLHCENCNSKNCSVIQYLRSSEHGVLQPELWPSLCSFFPGAFIFHHRQTMLNRISAFVKSRSDRKVNGTLLDPYHFVHETR